MATKRPKLSPAAASGLPLAGAGLSPSFAAECVLSYTRNRLLVPSLPCRAILDAYPDEASRLRDVFAGVAERHENATILVVGRRYLNCSNSSHRAVLALQSPSRDFVVCRGSRKGTLVRSALLEAERAYLSCQPKGAVERCPFVVVELHGSVLDDDGTAARELCRQLSIGSTLPRSRKSAMEHYLRFTLDSLKEGRAGNVPVFIMLHDFDLFARRAKQTLLYNLFDITQSSKYQVCVIGTTTRLDATELLEKRLRSRFSQRQILLGMPSLASTKELVHSLLRVEAEAVQLQLTQNEVRFVPQTVAAAANDWNRAVSALLLSRKAESTVERVWRLGRSIGWLQAWLHAACLLLAPPLTVLDEDHITRALDAVVGIFDPKAEAAVLLPQLSACDILLLIAMCKLERARELPTFSFDMVHFEYAKHVKSGNLSGKQISKSVLLKSFEKLISLRAVLPLDAEEVFFSTPSSISGNPLRFQMVRLRLAPSFLLEGIRSGSIALSVDVRRWALEE